MDRAKKLLSVLLVLSMVLGMVLPAVPIGTSAAEVNIPVAQNDAAWAEMPATCTEGGSWDSAIYCADCGAEISRKVVTVPALGHDFVNGECSRCDEGKPSRFTDVEAGDFFFDPVEWAVENGITTGVSNDLFDPNGQCMRAVVVTFLWRAAGEPEPTNTFNPFVDVKETS